MFGPFAETAAPGQKRAIGMNVVIYFLFALIAVVLLTRTAIAANAINRDVAQAIEPAVGNINVSTKNLAVLDTTADVTEKIAAGASPLQGHLSGVVDATTTINSNLESTDSHVTSIDESVEEIKASTGKIKPSIDDLNGTVDDIHDHVVDINKDFVAVAKGTTSIARDLNQTRASLESVLDGAGPLLATVRSILDTALKINAHTESIEGSPVVAAGGLDDLVGPLTSLGLLDPLLVLLAPILGP